jgi:serine-type D-Ala-D-Ala carboxypeptidase (penicillin-binding protein 5/6)
MGRRWPAVLALLTAGAVVLSPGIATGEDDPRPTVDPSAPSPTAPYAGLPPQGHGPGGVTIGGEELATRDVVVDDDLPALPDGVSATGWLVADLDTGDVVAARDPHGRYYPASTLKTLTLLTLMPRLDPDEVVVGTVEDESIEGSRVGLVEGGRYPVSLLFQALILQSGNDAANALARAAGGTEAVVEAMNETAVDLGAYDTVAGTPSGLDVAGQSSSPYDLALIFRELVENPLTAAVLRTPLAQMPPVAGLSAGYQIQNENPLFGHPGFLGGKTGFTDAARHTFVAAAERDGRRLVVSVMNTENRPLRAADQAALLLDWGFALPAGSEGVGTLVEPADLAALEETTSAAPEATSAAHATPAAVAAAATGDADSPLVPAALAVSAVLIVGATLVGRRRAVRPVRRPAGPRPAPRPDGGPPPRNGSRSTPP